MNMNPSVGIGTERDHHMIQLLQPFALMRLDELFPLLYNCKFDPQFWEELSVSNCLRFDYKLFDSPICNVGIASILIPLTNPSFILKSQLEMHCKQFMNSNQLKILVILSFSPFPNPQREFMVISESKTDVENLINTLNRDNETFLELAHIISENVRIVENNFANSGLFCQIFSQGNIKASRKVISPHIIRFQKMLEETVSICGR